MLLESTGTLHYGPGIRAIVTVDRGIVKFYKALIPKYFNVERQRYEAHITVVRLNVEVPPYMAAFGKYEGEEIKFHYDNQVYFDKKYFYLKAYSERIGEIREELGLSKYRMNDCYHITIGNTKP